MPGSTPLTSFNLKGNNNKAGRHILNLAGLATLPGMLSILFLLCIQLGNAHAQQPGKSKLIQFSGITRSETLDPLPFVSILNKTKKKGALTDQQGLFSLIVEANDTVIFASLGFKRTGIIIPDTLSTQFMSTDVILYSDTVHLKPVKIYPWKNYEEFKQAFLALRLPKNDLERAQQNIELIMKQVYATTSPDAAISYQHTMMDNFNRSANWGTVPTYGLFNVMNWAKFFQALKNGLFKNPHPDDQ